MDVTLLALQLVLQFARRIAMNKFLFDRLLEYGPQVVHNLLQKRVSVASSH
jgi:hypothetical protein